MRAFKLANYSIHSSLASILPRRLNLVLAEVRRARQGELGRISNSLALILGRVSSSGLGFLTWLITARLFSASEVGIASGVISAMMLCVQIALVGIGPAIITLYPQHEGRLARLLDTAFSMIAVASLLTAGLFLLLASVLFRELRIASTQPLYAALFLSITLFGTVNVLMDHISITLRRGDQVLARNVLFGAITIGAVFALPLFLAQVSSISIVLAWTLAGLGACSLGTLHLRRSLRGYFYRPGFERATGWKLVSVGLPNYLLTIMERAPNWILPIIVTETLSPTDNAHWYSTWMMAWVVFLIPISIGQNLFAEVSQHPSGLHEAVRHSTRLSLLLGSGAAGLAFVFAHLMLSLLGPGYAAAGVLPLRLLILAVIPATFIQAYYAVCRGTQRYREATVMGLVSGLFGVALAAAAGQVFGLTGMAVAWLSVQGAISVWALARLRLLERTAQFMAAG